MRVAARLCMWALSRKCRRGVLASSPVSGEDAAVVPNFGCLGGIKAVNSRTSCGSPREGMAKRSRRLTAWAAGWLAPCTWGLLIPLLTSLELINADCADG